MFRCVYRLFICTYFAVADAGTEGKGWDPICQFKGVGLSKPQLVPLFIFLLNLHHGIVMFKYIICQSFKNFTVPFSP
jgi:hypothetical protein